MDESSNSDLVLSPPRRPTPLRNTEIMDAISAAMNMDPASHEQVEEQQQHLIAPQRQKPSPAVALASAPLPTPLPGTNPSLEPTKSAHKPPQQPSTSTFARKDSRNNLFDNLVLGDGFNNEQAPVWLMQTSAASPSAKGAPAMNKLRESAKHSQTQQHKEKQKENEHKDMAAMNSSSQSLHTATANRDTAPGLAHVAFMPSTEQTHSQAQIQPKSKSRSQLQQQQEQQPSSKRLSLKKGRTSLRHRVENEEAAQDFAEMDDREAILNSLEQVKVYSHKKKSRVFSKLTKLQSFDGGGGSAVWKVAFNDSGSRLATGSEDGILRVFNVLDVPYITDTEKSYRFVDDSREQVTKFRGHTRDIVDLAWTRSEFIVTASLDCKVAIWFAGALLGDQHVKPLRILGHTDMVTSVAVHPFDETVILAGTVDGMASLWKIRSRISPSQTVGASGASSSIASDGKVFSPTPLGHALSQKKSSADDDIGAFLASHIDIQDVITSCMFSGDGKLGLMGTAQGQIKIFKLLDDISGDWLLQPVTQLEVRSTKEHRRPGDLNKVADMTSHPFHTNQIMVSTNDSKLRMYSLDDKSVQFKLYGHVNERSRFGPSFSPNDCRFVLCGSEPKSVRIWDTNYWNVINTVTTDSSILKRKKSIFGKESLSVILPKNSSHHGGAGASSSGSTGSSFGSFERSSFASGMTASTGVTMDNIHSMHVSSAEMAGRSSSFEAFTVEPTLEFAALDKNSVLTSVIFAPDVALPSTRNVAYLSMAPEAVKASAGLTIVAATSSGVVTVYRNVY